MKKSIVLLSGLFLVFSCEKEDVLAGNEFTVVVESKADLACSLPVIRFLDREDEVRKKTKLETLTYNAYHLESSLNVVGEELIIEFTELADEDMRVCNTLGITIPGLSIISARQANQD